jgi:hypothetical protein
MIKKAREWLNLQLVIQKMAYIDHHERLNKTKDPGLMQVQLQEEGNAIMKAFETIKGMVERQEAREK